MCVKCKLRSPAQLGDQKKLLACIKYYLLQGPILIALVFFLYTCYFPVVLVTRKHNSYVCVVLFVRLLPFDKRTPLRFYTRESFL